MNIFDKLLKQAKKKVRTLSHGGEKVVKHKLTLDKEAFMRKTGEFMKNDTIGYRADGQRQLADAHALKMLQGSMLKPEDVYVKQDGEFITKVEVERASRAMTKQALTMHKLKSEHNWIVVHQIGKQDARKLCVKCGSLKEIKDGDRDVFGPIVETLDPFTNQPLES